jgi:5-methylcytosine-specific restriction protein B
MTSQFTWIDIYQELADVLLGWQSRQGELIEFLESLRSQGYTILPLYDKNRDGERFLLRELDPFTFFGVFNRQIRDDQRIGILTKIKSKFELQSPVPTDFVGIPVVNNQRSWFFSYSDTRSPEDIPRLWRIFELALSDNSLLGDAFSKAFDEAVSVRGVNINLTMGLFWVRPRRYLSLDGTNRSYLGIELPKGGVTAQFYLSVLKAAAAKNADFPELSYTAWKTANKQTKAGINGGVKPLSDDRSYWLVGAYWDDRDPPNQTLRFLDEGIWENGYTHKFGDDVRSMKVGDKIAIKAAVTQRKNLPFDAQGRTISRMDIKARGTIVANRGDGRVVEVEWDTSFEQKPWYFYTARTTVWKLRTDKGYKHRDLSRKLIDFVWGDKEQDYNFFCDLWWRSIEASDTEHTNGKSNAGNVPEFGINPYGVEDMLAAGIFLEEAQIRTILNRLRSKKALILQGVPGVGKTFMARRLAYALMEEEAPGRLEMVQFHQSYSYDDFVRGYRPVEGQPGTFGLQNGIFFDFCRKAASNPEDKYVFIIDEINRGNLSLIFGELLMLIEADKRGDEFAVPLVYRKENEPRFFIPSNLYLIGLMNVADRSLAMVDYALRRRFAFFPLQPQYSSPIFRQWLADRSLRPQLIRLIVDRMTALNNDIGTDPLLGENYQIGHSYFCPKGDAFADLDNSWYAEIIATEIAPLLHEYWFDNPSRAKDAVTKLLANL